MIFLEDAALQLRAQRRWSHRAEPLPVASTVVTAKIGMSLKQQAACSPRLQGEKPMKNLFSAGILAVLIAVPSAGRAEDIARFAPLKTEELTSPQKAWADAIAI